MNGLIINKTIPQLMKGYPTVSDKYNVAGGILAGTIPVKFGELVKYSTTTGYYEAITETVTLTDIAGINLATNVKLVNEYGNPDAEPQVNVGEALNLMLDGYAAVELDATTAETTNIAAGKPVAILLTSGKLTTSGAAGATDLPGYTFTGIHEMHGTALFAEIRVK